MSDRGHANYHSSTDTPSRRLRLEGEATISKSLIAEARSDEERFLLKLGFSKPFISAMKLRAERNGTTIEAELLASGAVREDAYYGALAKVLGLPFHPVVDPAHVVDLPGADSQLKKPTLLRLSPPYRPLLTLIVPDAASIAERRRQVEGSAGLRSSLGVTTPSALRKAV